MPAKAKVTKEMIVDAAFAIAREAGVENINARTVSERLHCSTQPVMYHFATMEELKRTEKNSLCEGRSLSFGISDEYEKTAQGRCPWNRNELYSLCHRRTLFVPVSFSV